MSEEPVFALDGFPADRQLAPLWLAAWGAPLRPGYAETLRRSLCHATAAVDNRLVGFVKIAWDGGVHAFLLDTTVHPDFRRRGIATALVRLVTDVARARGAEWLHVDYEPHLDEFYRRCGFAPTKAGLMRLG